LNSSKTHAGVSGPYEVTQLINSFLGALAHPWERYRDDLSAIKVSAGAEAPWPKIAKERHNDREPDSFGDLVRLMRNAMAHGNIDFLPAPSGDIRALRLWNDERGRRTWGAVVQVADMRAFLAHFVKLAEELYDRQIKARPHIA
jgi:hypothetical protein